MSPKQTRYRLLLDEMLPAREKFPELNKFHNVRHIVHDFHKSGLTDDLVVSLAKKEKRIVVTKNSRHFLSLCMKHGVGLIGLTEEMPYEEIDKTITAKLRDLKITKEYIKISRSPRKR
jgi:hypothetical protein